MNQQVLEDLLTLLNDEFAKEAPLTVTQGKIHDYLRMVIDYTVPGKIRFTMKDFIQGVLDECLGELMKGGIGDTSSYVGSRQVSFLMCTLEIPQKIAVQVLCS